MTKIINTSGDSQEGTLILYLNQEAANSVHNGQRIAAQTPEGMEVKSFKPVFNMTEQNAKYMRKHQLDRWFIMEFEGMGLDLAASKLAQFGEVSRVQFNKLVTYGSDTRSTAPSEIQEEAEDNVFNDPRLSDQWHYRNTGSKTISSAAVEGEDIAVTDVWRELTAGDNEIIVAIIDGPVKYTHEDLKDNMWVNTAEKNGTPGVDDDENGYVDDVHGWNCDANNGQINWRAPNESGHGTHVAGIVGAVNNNGRGVCGVAGGTGNGDGVRLMGCQIFTGGVSSNTAAAAIAFVYAADNGASIAQCSFGYEGEGAAYDSDLEYSKIFGAEYDAIAYFMDPENNNSEILDGNIVIAAAGNERNPYSSYPAACQNVVSVTGLGPDFLPATNYTNYGPGCNIAAPGGETKLPPWTSYKALVLSTVPSETYQLYDKQSYQTGFEYGYMQGTSMACPHVSGVVALALSYAKKLGKTFDKETFKDMIITSANDLDQNLKGVKTYYNNSTLDLAQFYHKLGTGSIDAWKLMMQIEGIPCLTAEIGKNQWLDLSGYFGTASTSLTYLGVEVDEKSREALGLAADPYIQYGRLYIHPTKMGSGKVTVKAVGGGTEVGGGDKVGGMEVSHEVSIIARSFKSSNQGWL